MKTSINFNEQYFLSRDMKNALAISSNQSSEIESYNAVESKYTHTLKSADLKKCPDYWGGYIFTPYFFEFWQGHEKRINKKRICYKLIDQNWTEYFLLSLKKYLPIILISINLAGMIDISFILDFAEFSDFISI